jgi:poly(A) polymerase
MVDPRVVPRAEHTLSRRNIDPDALKVLYRLHQGGYTAYLVGGSVRDLLIGRPPKDFDIGTSAHPYQIKKLFRNCWIIGRRFRLAHVRFGQKIVEVATFRRQLTQGEEIVQDGVPAPVHGEAVPQEPGGRGGADHLIHHDNTFGTAEEDAFRRDFTINALFYDIATFSLIDYVGGLEDLQARIVRSIGDPNVRFREDPVRMMRAVALSARLDFRLDPPILEAIYAHRYELARSSPARLLEEYYKILRSGSAERTFRDLAALGLLEPVSAELHQGAGESLWRSLGALDGYRRRFERAPDGLTNPILLASVLVPLGLLPVDRWQESPSAEGDGNRRMPIGPRLGSLPLARRDVERLRQLLGLQRRLRDPGMSPRARLALAQRSPFQDALTWFEINAGSGAVVDQWRAVLTEAGQAPTAGQTGSDEHPVRRRRRRRRRRFRPAPR